MPWLVCDLDKPVAFFGGDTSDLANVGFIVHRDVLGIRERNDLHGNAAFLSEFEKPRQGARPASGASLNRWCAISSTRTTFNCSARAQSR